MQKHRTRRSLFLEPNLRVPVSPRLRVSISPSPDLRIPITALLVSARKIYYYKDNGWHETCSGWYS